MKLSERRKNLTETLTQRVNESYESRNDSGRFKGIIRDDIRVPQWTCKVGKHIIDIIPYVAGDGNPDKRIKKGDIAHKLDIWVHDDVGPNSDRYVCLSRNYGLPCPKCEHQKKLKDEGTEYDIVKKLNPKRRVFYNIVCYDTTEEEAKGLQVWEVAHYFMEMHLADLSHPKRGGIIPFQSPDKGVGKSVSWTREGGDENTRYIGHCFEERDYDIPDEILDSAFCLEEIIHVPTYEEFYQAYWGEPVPPKEELPGTSRLRGGGGTAVPPKEQPSDTGTPAPGTTTTTTTKTVTTCPYSGQFGIDTDKIPACAECEVFEICFTEFERRKSQSPGGFRRRVQ